jgi:hypothetical protein
MAFRKIHKLASVPAEKYNKAFPLPKTPTARRKVEKLLDTFKAFQVRS